MPPARAWQKAMKYAEVSKIKTQHRLVSAAIALLSDARAQLLAIHKRWPYYRRLQMLSGIRGIEKQRASLYKIVAEQGLVEYKGRFYRFEQILQTQQLQQERAAKWLKLLKAQEQARKFEIDRMQKEESKQQIQERKIQRDRALIERQNAQQRIQRTQQYQQRQEKINKLITLQDEQSKRRD